MYFMLDHIRLFDFINVSEWILPLSPSISVCLPPNVSSNDAFVLRGAAEGRGRLPPAQDCCWQPAQRHDGKLWEDLQREKIRNQILTVVTWFKASAPEPSASPVVWSNHLVPLLKINLSVIAESGWAETSSGLKTLSLFRSCCFDFSFLQSEMRH